MRKYYQITTEYMVDEHQDQDKIFSVLTYQVREVFLQAN